MTVKELIKICDIPVSSKQLAACEALESHGKTFCVDFGYENAEQKWHEMACIPMTHEDMKFLFACGIRLD